jgi:dienelactone hydrolase
MAPLGQSLAQQGAVVIAIDAPFARRTGDPVGFTTQDRAEQIQLIRDLQRAVDVLRARPNVDAARIAYLGVSYGGAMGALFVGIERRLKAAVLVVGDGGLVSHFTGPEDVSFMSGLSCATRVNWFRAMAPIEPIRFIGHAPPTALLLQNGQVDNLVPPADAAALHAAAPEPKTIRWYAAGHGLNQQAAFDRHDWLHQQIGLDARQ